LVYSKIKLQFQFPNDTPSIYSSQWYHNFLSNTQYYNPPPGYHSKSGKGKKGGKHEGGKYEGGKWGATSKGQGRNAPSLTRSGDNYGTGYDGGRYENFKNNNYDSSYDRSYSSKGGNPGKDASKGGKQEYSGKGGKDNNLNPGKDNNGGKDNYGKGGKDGERRFGKDNNADNRNRAAIDAEIAADLGKGAGKGAANDVVPIGRRAREGKDGETNRIEVQLK
jgi:hypothetical protein